MSRTTPSAVSLRRSVAFWALAAASCATRSADSAVSDARHGAAPVLEIPVGSALVVSGDRSAAGQKSVRLQPGSLVRPPLGVDGSDGVIFLDHLKHATIELDGVDLRGTPSGTDLDRNTGAGIVLRNCEDVTLRGGKIGGYKVCVAAFECSGLILDGLQFDAWYGMRLLSTPAAEDESDWLFPHKNDDGEWRTNYGGAIALEDCENAVVRNCSGRHGQNGILLTRTNGCTLYDDDFSFLSGWGLALYRSSKNAVSHCLFDYCVRGFSPDVYWRGQDSAGILMFERCSDNVFVENSATHGGDGVFLFAGRDTVEGLAFAKGEMDAGGSDRNVWYGNDFSYAVANAIEATFSCDNWALQNKLNGSHMHGVWGGYSSRMVIAQNEISGTLGGGVSIEHGQECMIVDNELADDDIALELWWDEDKELVGGPYGQNRDTSSRDAIVRGNRFSDNARDVVITKTTGVMFADNEFRSKNQDLVLERVSGIDAAGKVVPDAHSLLAGKRGTQTCGRIVDSTLRAAHGEWPESMLRALAWKPAAMPGTLKVFAKDRGEKQGLDTIVMGEWGPWDFRSGEPRPNQRQAGGVLAGATWDAVWFAWTPEIEGRASTDPRKNLEAYRALAQSPIAAGKVSAWVNPWGGDKARAKAVGAAHFGLEAKTTIELAQAGRYRLATVSDDGVRVIVDGKTALENWTWHGPTRDAAEIELTAGAHTLTLEYFQIDGAYALTIDLERIDAR
jgi:hypothetical protein